MTAVRQGKFSEYQIALALRQAESVTLVVEICRKLVVTEQSFYRWKRKFVGMGVTELRRLKELERENQRFKHLELSRPVGPMRLRSISYLHHRLRLPDREIALGDMVAPSQALMLKLVDPMSST